MWPERGKTGVARLALASGATVVPVAQWGAHEVLPYTAPKGLLGALGRALRRRPVVRVHFAAPVDLSGLSAERPGDALRATDRILDAITRRVGAAAPRRARPAAPRRPDPAGRPGSRRRRPPGPQDTRQP